MGDPRVGIYAVHADGTGRRPLITRPANSDDDLRWPTISPDGNLLAYTDDAQPSHEHIVDLRTGEDRVLPGSSAQFAGSFSPDGKNISYLRSVYGDLFQIVVAPVDGSSAPAASLAKTVARQSGTGDVSTAIGGPKPQRASGPHDPTPPPQSPSAVHAPRPSVPNIFFR
jgi:Tol biopolymer transport system component